MSALTDDTIHEIAKRSSSNLIFTQFKDPITNERRTVVLCELHTSRMREILRSIKRGCSSTSAPGLSVCDACANIRSNR